MLRKAYRMLLIRILAIPMLCAGTQAQWVLQSSGTTANLRGVHNVGQGFVWASGTGGTVLRTVDGGARWSSCAKPPDAGDLDFRAVWAWNADEAMVMSSGPGDKSRLYQTRDGCRTWAEVLRNTDPSGFWDGLVFANNTGWILGDPVEGRFVIMKSTNRGLTWRRESDGSLAAGKQDEGGFAASNTSIVALPVELRPVFGTSGPRVYRRDKTSWQSVVVPLAGGPPTAGVFSIAFRDARHGMAVGGDFKKPNVPVGTAALTSDGGITWIASKQPPHGYRSAVELESLTKVWIAVGPTGTDLSRDDGKTWAASDNQGWNGLALPWVVGPSGMIGKLQAPEAKEREVGK